jgi:alcohol dehydrogenase class IV
LQAIRLIAKYLPMVVADPKDEEARTNLQIAATMAGWAFSIAQVGLAHAMAHTIGILHNVPHGAACGIVLPKVMRFNVDFASDKLTLVAQAMGVNTGGLDDRTAGLAAADAVETLMKNSRHPMRLRDVGVTEDNLPICAFHAMGDAASLFNARPVSDPQEVLNLYLEAY